MKIKGRCPIRKWYNHHAHEGPNAEGGVHKRKGMSYTFSKGERVVAMVVHKEHVYVATEKSIYIELEKELHPLEIVEETR